MSGPAVLFKTGIHSARPAAAAGTVHYYCTTDSKIEQSDGTSWSDLYTFSAGFSDPMTTRGDVIVRNASNATARLAIGSTGKVLSSDGTDISWQTPSAGFSDPMTTRGDVIIRNSSNATARLGRGSAGTFLSSDGTDVSWQTPGAGTVSPSYLGYNTVGGSTQAMAERVMYCKQFTAGGSGNVLLGIQAYLDITVEATVNFSFALWADSSDTVGDLISARTAASFVAPIHASGNYPARWLGGAVSAALAASTKYWVGVSWAQSGGTANPRLYYDASGSDRSLAATTGGYIPDGVYVGQTDTTHKHSIRALVL